MKIKIILLTLALVGCAAHKNMEVKKHDGILLVDGEDAYLNEQQRLFDGGRMFTVSRDGMDDATATIWDKALVNSTTAYLSKKYKRAGEHSLAYKAVSNTSNEYKQRVEHRIGGRHEDPSHGNWKVHQGYESYRGFSIMLDPDTWTAPRKRADKKEMEWDNIIQLKQVGYKVYSNFLLHWTMDGTNTLSMSFREGVNGSNGFHTVKIQDVITLKPGVWYDLVFGFRYNTETPTGFCNLWIKEASAEAYQKFGWEDTKFGYSGGELEMLSMSQGIYRRNTDRDCIIYFDEVRLASTFEEASITGKNKL